MDLSTKNQKYQVAIKFINQNARSLINQENIPISFKSITVDKNFLRKKSEDRTLNSAIFQSPVEPITIIE